MATSQADIFALGTRTLIAQRWVHDLDAVSGAFYFAPSVEDLVAVSG
jgi:hypothetical protein